MDLDLSPFAIKIILGLFTAIGILIGIIWRSIRLETKEIKENIKDLSKIIYEIPINYMSKKDCERTHDNNHKEKN